MHILLLVFEKYFKKFIQLLFLVTYKIGILLQKAVGLHVKSLFILSIGNQTLLSSFKWGYMELVGQSSNDTEYR